MTTTNYTSGVVPGDTRSEIERNRAGLGDTVTALAARAHPRERVRGALSQVRERAPRAVRGRPARVTAGVAGALTAAGAVAVFLRRRRAAKARAARNRWLPGFLRR
ncbi:DUF3618 domain-containing protein [Amorphoplanes digitatis]|uniref:DUF3618 domain-containing protein n=1 Tax=Actinoplanes digitatis TaxID=1868 RepID=A0A7W7HW56_9ACTN|nr:DUF3618 domain-containing protein [Actinoplanes digitatis]MBB4761850.1 hypothetical protein [Actinoplanes digitatis]GID90961.1 hypothetical protein Adi01nite_03730 [Actinoplanes digitatis]